MSGGDPENSSENQEYPIVDEQASLNKNTPEDADVIVNADAESLPPSPTLDSCDILTLRWRSSDFEMSFTPTDYSTFTILDLKMKIEDLFSIPTDKQKLLGISPVSEDAMLSNIEFKKDKRILLLGTPILDQLNEEYLVKNLPAMLRDIDLDDGDISTSLVLDSTNITRLHRVISTTEIAFINPPREDKGLLVLDLDYTLLDWTGAKPEEQKMRRPFLHSFLKTAFQYFNIGIWSQTHWRWVESKCNELNLFFSREFQLCFALDRTSMFSVAGTKTNGRRKNYEVKALNVIWSKFPELWGAHNTLHVDDLARNFLFNPSNGIKVKAYKASMHSEDNELNLLSNYIIWVAKQPNYGRMGHGNWRSFVKDELLKK